MRIYVAGPYSKGDQIINTRNAILAGEEIIRKGHIPYVPHLSQLWHTVSPHEPKFWYDLDIEWLRLCHAVLRLPGDSVGADAEVAEAKRLGLPVYLAIEDIPSIDSSGVV